MMGDGVRRVIRSEVNERWCVKWPAKRNGMPRADLSVRSAFVRVCAVGEQDFDNRRIPRLSCTQAQGFRLRLGG
jgi:hypothetical protein